MYGQSHNFEFLFLPPNSTPFLQPLDDLPFANFKKNVKKLVRDSQMCFATQKDTKNTILEIVHVAFAQTFTTKVVSDAWRCPRSLEDDSSSERGRTSPQTSSLGNSGSRRTP